MTNATNQNEMRDQLNYINHEVNYAQTEQEKRNLVKYLLQMEEMTFSKESTNTFLNSVYAKALAKYESSYCD